MVSSGFHRFKGKARLVKIINNMNRSKQPLNRELPPSFLGLIALIFNQKFVSKLNNVTNSKITL